MGLFLNREPMKWATPANQLQSAQEPCAAHYHGLEEKNHSLIPG
jgi:hypothetical protein